MSNKEAQSLEIRQVMTINLNNRPYEYAKTLNERKLLATLSAGDVITQEHKYHIFCLPGLYNRKRRYLIATRRLEQDMHSMKIPAHRHSQSYLHILWRLSDLKRVLQSSDLQIYFTCMPNTWNSCALMHPLSTPQDLGEKTTVRNTGGGSSQAGKIYLLAFHKDVGFDLLEASDYYSKAVINCKAANNL